MSMTVSRRSFIGGTVGIGLGALGAGSLASCAANTGKTGTATLATNATGSTDLIKFLQSSSKPYKGAALKVLTVSSPQADSIKALLPEFFAATGINVEFVTVSENELITRTQITMASKSGGFDLFQVLSFFVPLYAQNSWLTSVEALKADPKITYPGLALDSFAESAVAQLSSKNSLWGLPMFMATQVMYYRTDIFDTVGVKPATSLGSMTELCSAINGKPLPAIAMRAGIGPTQNVFPWTAWLYNGGGKYFEDYDAASGKYSRPALTSSNSIGAAELYSSLLRNYGTKGGLNWNVADITRSFLAGGVSIIQEGSPFGATLNDPKKSSVAGKVGAFAIPSGVAGQFAPSASQGWGVNGFSKQQEAAWLFAQWATSSATMTKATIDQSFSSPPITALYTNDRFLKKYGFPGYMEALQQSFATKASPIGGPYLPGLVDWQKVGRSVSVSLNEVINGQRSAAAAMAQANAALAAAV